MEHNLQDLTSNIPGGVYQCKNDSYFSLTYVNEGFLSICGYTREEIREIYDDHYLKMIYHVDRDEILKAVDSQIKSGKEVELEYRVITKSGNPVWVIDKARLVKDKDGNESFYCVLMEVTERRREQEELRLSLERHQIIMDQAADIIFEWDIRKDTLNFSSNFHKKFGYDAISTNISKEIPLSKDVLGDDMPLFLKIMQDTAAGVPFSQTEFRIRDAEEKYFWCRVRATTQYDSEGNAIKAIGVIADIDAEKKQKQELYELAQKDALTGLYNKAAINTLVERRIAREDVLGFQALFIIDVDYFKEVNDTYGHLTGDSVLSDVAVALKENVRNTDLVGRIGGDEFLVYLYEVSGEEAALKKAEHLRDNLRKITPKVGAPSITCSIGGIVFLQQEVDYQALYKKADKALYYRKKNGRDGVTIYNLSLFNGEEHLDIMPTAVGEDIVSNQGVVVNEQIPQYTFRTLYTATDVESAIVRLLEIIGRSYDVSRAYIFEGSEDGLYCSNTFEWCNVGIRPEIDNLQNLSYEEDLAGYIQNFDDTGLFYCADVSKVHPDLKNVLEPQGIRSMLQCAVLDEGEFRGFVGFDECRDRWTWSREQVNTFKLTADILATFLVKFRQKRRLTEQSVKSE